MSILLFLTAIVLSGIAAYYSVIGLIAIFSAAVIPVAIMGGSLEAAKLVVASWLYRYWSVIPILMRGYFTAALIILMLITSMGIFGFLSKAHSDQSLVSGDVLAKISVYDEKIRIAKDNIDANRKALKQLDEAVDQVMARSTSETGADKAVAIRRQQARERDRLIKEIAAEQKTITKLNEEAAPIRAEVRKVEAEVGPIKYIAALIYGDNPDQNLLERSVRWLIILLIAVFDPLAVLMLIAANLTQMRNTEWNKNKNEPAETPSEPKEDQTQDVNNYKIIPNETVMPVAGQATDVPQAQTDNGEAVGAQSTTTQMEAVGVEEKPHHPDTHPYLLEGFKYPAGWMFSPPVVYKPETEPQKEEPQKEEPQKEEPKKKVKKSHKKTQLDPISPSPITDVPEQPIEQKQQDKSLSETVPVKPDFEAQINEMITNNDDEGLETVYKKIVKELAKKNRAKSTHWGPLKTK